MASTRWLTTFVLALPIVTLACFQSPPSTEILRKADVNTVEVSPIPENSSGRLQSSNGYSPRTPYAKYAKKHAATFGLDWKLVIAVIEKESSFRHSAVSPKGAYGLMQIMPGTRAEIREKLGIAEARSPYNNVKAGSYYLNRLSRNFKQSDEQNRLKLTLAAYNAGLTRVRDAQRIARYLGEDGNSWENVRAALPLLSRRFKSLHKQVWDDGRPRGGYFGNPEETIEYVDRVLGAYAEYALVSRDNSSI